jgi:hypothetical protein
MLDLRLECLSIIFHSKCLPIGIRDWHNLVFENVIILNQTETIYHQMNKSR